MAKIGNNTKFAKPIVCEKCNKPISRCPMCGEVLKPTDNKPVGEANLQIECPRCGTKIEYCPYCGQ